QEAPTAVHEDNAACIAQLKDGYIKGDVLVRMLRISQALKLANIIWDEEGKSEDHIVPYPNEAYEISRGPCGEDTKVSDKEDANVKLTKKTVSITDSQEGSSTHNERLATDRFCTLTNLSRSNLDLQHIDEKGQEDNGSQFFDAQVEDREESNFVDYGWANVGNFEDLDKILSNHDLPLWSSTKSYVTGCPAKTDLLSTDSPISRLEELKSEHDETIHGFMNEEELKQKSASDEMEIGKWYQGSPTTKRLWDEVIVLRQPTFKGFQELLHAIKLAVRIILGYNMMRNQHSAGTGFPHQQVSSASSYVSDKSQGPPSRPLSMTPQEKIEKLRRRQQMRALLAIRKQKQEFARAGNIEIDENLTDSDTRPVMMDKSTLADTLLHQLENVIARLGVEIRLCIRDSLFRLAESALQRHCEGDIVSANRSRDDPTAITEERLYTTKSSARTPDGETKTNPLDRAVAHLLFHTPPELSGELLQQSSSAKFPLKLSKVVPAILGGEDDTTVTMGDVCMRNPVFGATDIYHHLGINYKGKW
ncbi:protein LNK2 isoform X3, partial [Tanacetum coccineum]